MKVVADENIEGEIVRALRSGGFEVIDIKESFPGIGDAEVLSIASSESALLLTNDKDFGELIYRERHLSAGVVLLRFGKLEIAERSELLVQVLTDEEDNLRSSFTVITPTGIRIRK